MSTFRDGREGCRALLTDVNLGDGISGWELARQIREITPGFPVVYMTSASAGDWKSQGVAGSFLIEKPLRRRNWRPSYRSYSIPAPRRGEPGSRRGSDPSIGLATLGDGSAETETSDVIVGCAGNAFALHAAAARTAATAIQSRSSPLSSLEKDARRLRSSSVSPGWHRA